MVGDYIVGGSKATSTGHGTKAEELFSCGCSLLSFMIATYCGIRSKTSGHTSEVSLEQTCISGCISQQGLE